MPYRILFVVANDWYFCCHRLPLAERVMAAGYDVHVATPPGRYRGTIERAGLHFHPVEIDRQGRNPVKDVATIARLTRLYASVRPTLVHHVALKPVVYGSIAARLARVRAVVNAMAGMGYVFLSKQLLSRTIRPGIMTALRALVNAPNVRVILQNPDDVRAWTTTWRVIRPDRVALVRGAGVDVEHFSPSNEVGAVPLVILPARLLYDKGVAEFVEAARILRRKRLAVRFALVGEGDPGNPSSVPRAQLESWATEGVVELFGWHDNMVPILRKAHVVCLPSYGEGLPKALLEAAACGRAIVATDVPGCREIVTDGVNGLLVPPRDAAALAAAIAKLVGDPVLRREMGERGRQQVVSQFSIDAVAKATLAVYAELLSATSSA